MNETINKTMNETPLVPSVEETKDISSPPSDARSDFFAMSEEEWETLKEKLSLVMSVSDLFFCKHYFSSVAHREPTRDELICLDHIVSLRKKRADRYRIARITQSADAVTATCLDLFQKQLAIEPKNKLPLRLIDTTRVANRYLNQIGAGQPISAEAYPPQGNPSATARFPAETAFLFFRAPLSHMAEQFFDTPAVAARIQNRVSLNRHGIMPSLLPLVNGLFIDLSRLPTEETVPLDISALFQTDPLSWICSVKREDVAVLSEEAERVGLTIHYFAKATNSGYWNFAKESNPDFHIEINFLQSLSLGTQDGLFQLCDPQTIGRYFFHPMRDALLLALTLSAQGFSRRSFSLNVQYRFPKHAVAPQELGADLSVVLGIYRVLIELGITADDTTQFDDTLEKPTWEISPPSSIATYPSAWQAADTTLYFVPVPMADSDLPDFSECRLLCDRLSAAAKRGEILSVHPCSASLQEVAQKADHTLFATWNEQVDPTFLPHSYGLILESRCALNFLEVGCVRARVCQDTPKNPEESLEENSEETRSSTVESLLL